MTVLVSITPEYIRQTFSCFTCTSGGCDGCVNIDNDSNNGLADLIADLEDVYEENDFASVISRYT